jgi:hypothetical protein
MPTKKLIVQKTDEAATIAEKLIDAQADEVVLVVPRFSKLAESGTTFRLLKREADALGKHLIVESVDPHIVKLAAAHGIECTDPFFGSESGAGEPARPRALSDIVTSPRRKAPAAKHRVLTAPEPEEAPEAPAQAHPVHVPHEPRSLSRRMRGLKLPVRSLALPALFAIIVGGALFVALAVLPKATVGIILAKTEWSYDGTVALDTSLIAPDPNLPAIPGQEFSTAKNLELTFPATGKKELQDKAAGKLTIWNTGSSKPQALVATTRFETPDHKIFRLVAGVTVPGASVEGGKVIPSSVDAQVVADKPGPAWNVGPVAKLTIPGFSGSEKFGTFYGELKSGTQGGFTGVSAYPTDADVKAAKASASQTLQSSMTTVMRAQMPQGLTIPDGALQFKVLKQTVNPKTNESGQFSVFTEAELSLVAFREADLLSLLAELVRKQAGADFKAQDYTLGYEVASYKAGKLEVPLHYAGILTRDVRVEDLREQIAGKSETDLRALLFSIPGLESAKISLWPFWVRSVPKDLGRVEVTTE